MKKTTITPAALEALERESTAPADVPNQEVRPVSPARPPQPTRVAYSTRLQSEVIRRLKYAAADYNRRECDIVEEALLAYFTTLNTPT